MIEGVVWHPLRQFIDDRGRTMHMLRNDDPAKLAALLDKLND